MRLGCGTTGVNWMEVIRDMDGGDTRFLGLELGETGPGWMCVAQLETLMCLRWFLDESEIQFLGPKWR